MKYAFIEAKRHVWPISLLCELLEVSTSGWHQWRYRKVNKKSRANHAQIQGADRLATQSTGGGEPDCA